MIKHVLKLMWNKKGSNFLILLEIFFAFLILFAVFAFAIYNLRIYQTPLGYNTENTWIARLTFPTEADSLAKLETRRQLLREVQAMPEVRSAAFIGQIVPFDGGLWRTSNDDNGFELSTLMYFADERLAETAELTLSAGRWFDETDLAGKYRPIVITRMLQEEFFGDRPVLDSIIYVGGDGSRVVGIVDHFKYRNEFSAEEPLTFFLETLGNENMNNLQLRLQPNVAPEFEATLNETIARITKRRDFTIEDLEAKRARSSRSTWIPIIAALAICGFLILNVALGLFGVLYYNISKRKAEIGLRRAIGAAKGEISLQFILEILAITFLGMGLASLLAVQFPLLELIPIPADNFFWSILATTVLISLVVVLCAFWPSRQASSLHPALALHEE